MPAACRALGEHEFSDSDGEYETAAKELETRSQVPQADSRKWSQSTAATRVAVAGGGGDGKAAASRVSRTPPPRASMASRKTAPSPARRSRAASQDARPSTAGTGPRTHCLALRGLSQDVTQREVHVLFSGCSGYIGSDVLDQESGAVLAVVLFEKWKDAAEAHRTRALTTWYPGQESTVKLEILDSDAAQALIGPTSLFQGTLLARGQRPGASDQFQEPQPQSPMSQLSTTWTSRGTPREDSSPQARSALRSTSPLGAPPADPLRWNAGRTLRGAMQSRGRPGSPHAAEVSFGRVPTVMPARAGSPRAAHLRRLRGKVEAAAKDRGIGELQAMLRHAEDAGMDEDLLEEPREVLRQKQIAILRHKSIHAATRARAKIKEALLQVHGEASRSLLREEHQKTPAEIAMLEGSIVQGLEACDLLSAAGLSTRERSLRQLVNKTSRQWRMECVVMLNDLFYKRDAAGLEGFLPECTAAGLSENLETHGLYEAAENVVSGIHTFEEEETQLSARGHLNRALASMRAPRIRQALGAMEAKEVDMKVGEGDRANRMLKEAENRVVARWALISSHAVARSAVFFDVPDAILGLQGAVSLAETAHLSRQEVEDAQETVQQMVAFGTGAFHLRKALRSKDMVQLKSAILEIRAINSDSPAVQHLLDKANRHYRAQSTKAGVRKRLVATLDQRKTVVISTLPDVLKEAESVGVEPETMDEAYRMLDQARARKGLEIACRKNDPIGMRSAIARAQDVGLNIRAIEDAARVLEETELRQDIEAKLEIGDRAGLAELGRVWKERGFENGLYTRVQKAIVDLEALAVECKTRLDRFFMSNQVTFDGGESLKIALEGQKTVRAAADILKKYPKVPIRVDGHFAHKNEGSSKQISLDRAKAVLDLLRSLGVDNILVPKGWGTSHPKFKTRAVRLCPF